MDRPVAKHAHCSEFERAGHDGMVQGVSNHSCIWGKGGLAGFSSGRRVSCIECGVFDSKWRDWIGNRGC